MTKSPLLIGFLLCASVTSLHAQDAGAYVDPGAAQLVARARAFRDAADSTILSYTGTVRSRIAAALRMPLKDRTLYRRESSSRIRWSRDGTSTIKVLAYREQTPGGLTIPGMANLPDTDDLFDPTQDRIYFGLTDDGKDKRDNDDLWIEHPLVEGAEQHYRYQSGDTLSISLQDGRVIRAIELRVLPRVSSGRLVTGSLWIDPSNGTVVQALYRLSRPLDFESEMIGAEDREDMGKVPGMLKPITFDISLVAVEYGLHEFKYWLPRITRFEGNLRAGMFSAPGSYEISYDIEEVVTATPQTVAAEAVVSDSVFAAWGGADHHAVTRGSRASRRTMMLMPRDSMSLLTSPDLPPPVWQKNADFITDRELDRMHERLGRISNPESDIAGQAGLEYTWGMGGSDLVRYNRVEALSVGARVATTTLPWVTLSATARFGLGDLHPNAELGASRSNRRRTVSLRLRHALEAVDPVSDAFGMGNSASALIFGRDDGEYYRVTGAHLSLSPGENARRSKELIFFAQHDNDVERNTNLTLRSIWNNDFEFRPNVAAANTELIGATLHLRPWWGTDPLGLQGGLDMQIEGATGGYEFARARVTARTAFPLPAKLRAGIEAGAGTSEGDVPPQRLWYLGGAGTLRGYDGSTLSGTSFARARVEVARTFGFGGLTLFSDAGWAGERDAFAEADFIHSAGIGASLLDGMLRMDLAHALNTPPGTLLRPQSKWRIEMYLDALL